MNDIMILSLYKSKGEVSIENRVTEMGFTRKKNHDIIERKEKKRMRKVNGFAKVLMILILILITVTIVLFGYLVLTDQKNQEVYAKEPSQVIQNYANSGTENQMAMQNQQEEIKDASIITAHNLFYVQLDDNAKIMYTALENHQEDMKSGDYRIEFGYQFNDLLQEEGGAESLNQSFQSAWNAYRFDHMEVFYLDVSKIFLFTKTTIQGGISTYEVSLGAQEGENYLASGYETKEDIEKAEQQIEMQVNELVAFSNGTTAEKIKQVHNWLVDNLSYAQNGEMNPNAYDIYGAFVEKQAVCEGYARAFKLLMDKMEIPCILIAGTGTNSNGETESHAWNYVYIDGIWYAVDVTWDDPVIVGNGLLDEERKYQYFLKGSDEFFQTHTQNGILSDNSMEFLYPELAKENYEG